MGNAHFSYFSQYQLAIIRIRLVLRQATHLSMGWIDAVPLLIPEEDTSLMQRRCYSEKQGLLSFTFVSLLCCV